MHRPQKMAGFGPLLILALLCCVAARAQNSPAPQQIQQLAAAQQWQALAQLLAPVSARTADQDFYYGSALAHLHRDPEAESAFAAGRRLAPRDPRFPEELAGVAFQQRRYQLAARRMQRALRLAPRPWSDAAYANDFLGTVYYLEGNLPAALKYWNRVAARAPASDLPNPPASSAPVPPPQKPYIVSIRDEPQPRVSPALLDRAFAFSPAATLQLPQFLATEARVDGLGIFPQYSLDLTAREDGRFDAVFRATERDGLGPSPLVAAALLLRGLPFQSVNPDYYDIRRHALNFTSLYRWDAQKRRVSAQFSGPFESNPAVGFVFATDLRDENWALRSSFTGPAPVVAGFDLRHEALSFSLASHAAAWNWSAGAELSHRDFRSIDPGATLTPTLLARGYQLKPQAALSATLLRLPEHRFTLDAGLAAEAARLWSQPQQAFEKLQGSLGSHWALPGRSKAAADAGPSQGSAYETRELLRACAAFGPAPFDELFMLGLERDNDLPLHAHIGTRDGRKGSAPLGRSYFLSNWELDRRIYSNGLAALQLGPLLDIGKIGKLTNSSPGPDPGLGTRQWLFDLGAQLKLRVFGAGVSFSYGRDLRTGNNAFYVTVLSQPPSAD